MYMLRGDDVAGTGLRALTPERNSCKRERRAESGGIRLRVSRSAQEFRAQGCAGGAGSATGGGDEQQTTSPDVEEVLVGAHEHRLPRRERRRRVTG